MDIPYMIPCNKHWGGKLYDMVLTYTMGFKTLHGYGDHDNATMENYGDVGFGLILDTKLAPLMHLRFWGNPSLGLGSTNDLVISHVSLVVWYWPCTKDGGDTLVNEGKLSWFHGIV